MTGGMGGGGGRRNLTPVPFGLCRVPTLSQEGSPWLWENREIRGRGLTSRQCVGAEGHLWQRNPVFAEWPASGNRGTSGCPARPWDGPDAGRRGPGAHRGVLPVQDDLGDVFHGVQKVIVPPLIPVDGHRAIFVHAARKGQGCPRGNRPHFSRAAHLQVSQW